MGKNFSWAVEISQDRFIWVKTYLKMSSLWLAIFEDRCMFLVPSKEMFMFINYFWKIVIFLDISKDWFKIVGHILGRANVCWKYLRVVGFGPQWMEIAQDVFIFVKYITRWVHCFLVHISWLGHYYWTLEMSQERFFKRDIQGWAFADWTYLLRCSCFLDSDGSCLVCWIYT